MHRYARTPATREARSTRRGRGAAPCRYALSTPTLLPKGPNGTWHHIGGPHAIREAPDGALIVCLKGNLAEEPQYDDPHHADYYTHIKEAEFAREGEPVPDAYAVWKVPRRTLPRRTPPRAARCCATTAARRHSRTAPRCVRDVA